MQFLTYKYETADDYPLYSNLGESLLLIPPFRFLSEYSPLNNPQVRFRA